MEPVLQHPDALVIALFDGEPAYPITLLRSAHAQVGRWDAYFHIIGESHAVILAHDGRPQFSETLACIPVEPSRCAYHHSLQDLQAHQVQHGRHQMAVAFGAPEWDIPDRLHAQLSLTFPPVLGQTPVTRIQWHLDDTALHWWTLHEYPLAQETITVYTRSCYDLRLKEDSPDD